MVAFWLVLFSYHVLLIYLMINNIEQVIEITTRVP